ncbi:HD domain-containing phosphohydrolase [Athalassotoga saccharophila]|uniref:3'3'-cGAMP-specific phosphodiesterase 3 n=1 Tax=Athalassotoga saccharophila TaxID=1441386 RepID=A0A6N4TDK0_9BACT|nr:HD domain-containing phosphohydrolase [Athalassotoga saccharophila]BBJ29068.1 3'3'-cGAMP-specific phosphodiesterase 3 [Athalassotoga saccharophila]
MANLERYFRMLSECNQILLRAEDENTLARQICDAIVNIGGFDSAFVGLLKGDRLNLEISSGVLKQYADKIKIEPDNPQYSSGASGRALKDGQTHIYNDVTYEKDYDVYRDIINETGLKANMAVAIKVDEKIIGTIGVYSKIPGIFTDIEKRLFEELAGDLAYGITAMRSKKRIEKLNEILKSIRMANQRIAKEDNLDNLLEGFCKDLESARFYHGVAIYSEGKIYCAGDCCPVIKECIKSGELEKCTDEFQVIDYKCPVHPDSKPACIKKAYGTLFVCGREEIFDDPEQVSLLEELAGDLGVGIERILNRSDALTFGRIVQNLSEEIHIVDPDTLKYKLVNPITLRRLGYTFNEIKEIKASDVKTDLTFDEIKEMLEPLRRHEKEYVQFETIHKRKDGTTYPVMISVFYNDDPVNPSYVAIATDLSGIKGMELKINSLVDSLVIALSDMVEVKDPYTAGHQRRVSMLAVRIGKEMGLKDEEIKEIEIAGLLHDIGKISIPLDILTKPSKLKKTEFELIKDHVEEGYKILRRIKDFETVATMVRQHHERINGSGYPLEIKGDKMAIGGKILAVADVVEAMSSHRPYRAALGIEAALEEINDNIGILYDEDVVKACNRVFDSGWTFDTPEND